MINLLDIRKSCVSLLNENFPEMPVKSIDVTKGFERPSLVIDFEDVQPVTLESLIEVSLTVKIYYFPDLNIEDLALNLDDAKFRLPLIFGNKLHVKDRYFDVNDPSTNTMDNSIVFEFGMLFYFETEEELAPLIETLNYSESEGF